MSDISWPLIAIGLILAGHGFFLVGIQHELKRIANSLEKLERKTVRASNLEIK